MFPKFRFVRWRGRKYLLKFCFRTSYRGSRLTYLTIHFVLKRNRENVVWAFLFKKRKGGTKDRIFVPCETKYIFRTRLGGSRVTYLILFFVSYFVWGVNTYLIITKFREHDSILILEATSNGIYHFWKPELMVCTNSGG